MKTTFKHVSYFYPTSGNAKRFNLPDGGYDVALTTSDGREAKTEWAAGFATEAEAMAHAETLPNEWASWQKFPASPEGVACVPAAPEFLRTAATNEHILAACERHMGLKSERGTFKPYMVICDGKSTFLKTAKALMNFISTVAQGDVCRVFRNAGHGATIDFDNIKEPTPLTKKAPLVIGDVQEGPAITAARAALGVYPSPAESVPLEATPSSTSPGLDSSSADVPPVGAVCKAFCCTLPAGHDGKHLSCNGSQWPAEREEKLDAVKVVERCAMWLGKMIADGGHLNSVAPNDAVGTLQRAEAFLKQEAVSHAAHLAKIQRLETALRVIESMDPYLGHAMQEVASDALSLPSAPLGS